MKWELPSRDELPIGWQGKRIAELEARLAELQEAVTPSEATKAAYMGEFSMRIPELDENGEEFFRTVNVPWVTIKKIMKAIQNRAAVDALIGGAE